MLIPTQPIASPPPRLAQWIRDGQTVLVTGQSDPDVLACALGHHPCRLASSAGYLRVSRLLDQLALAGAHGSYPKLIQRFEKTWPLSSRTGASLPVR